MSYYARFEEIGGHLFRFDTRIYLAAHNPQAAGDCVGAIVGKNPGSASPQQLGVWTTLERGRDNLLPTVRRRFLDAYEQAGKAVPTNAFVQVWNLFYLCGPRLGPAKTAVRAMPTAPECPTEGNAPPRIVWFAWGGSDRQMNAFKERFLLLTRGAFYYDPRSRSVVARVPSKVDFAKHPQGLFAEPIVHHLAKALRRA